ncbi:MAG: hypothetical protein Q7W45_09590 [Bacteroidota bacterium]|nr:hypothetical protein [Bacteroidota bacterium]MDP3144068.1 hypothetical protein [Bacteroidota bacterium]
MPTAVIVFKYNFFKVMLVACSGGITGNIIFTNLSAFILKWMHIYREKRNIKKKIFTKTTRRMIRIKHRFGLAGIAAITPLISQPIGAFFAEKFFKDKKKIIFYLSISVIIWAMGLYFILYIFHDQLKIWGII